MFLRLKLSQNPYLIHVVYFLKDGRWDVVGSSLVTNNYVRLTQDSQSRRGGLWNNVVRILKHLQSCSINNQILYFNFSLTNCENGSFKFTLKCTEAVVISSEMVWQFGTHEIVCN